MTTKLNEGDLKKGVEALKAAANAGNPLARRGVLFQKAQDGSATPEEIDELRKSLGSSSLADAATAPISGSDTIKKSIDVSDFLREATNGMTEGLRVLADHISKSQGDDHGFRIAAATTIAGMHDAIVAQGEMIKSIAAQVGVAMNQPARGPRSQGVRAEPMAKSFAGQPAPQGAQAATTGEDLSKGQILDVMDDMHLSKGIRQIGGEDMLKAISKYEHTNLISPSVLKAVQEHAAKMGKTAA